MLEIKYTRRASAYFGRMLRQIRMILPDGLDLSIEDMLEASLTRKELEDVFQLDMVTTGRLREARDSEPEEIWLAVEISAVIDRNDIERVMRRAALLRKAGLKVIPVVAGEAITQGATQQLQDNPVVLVLNGRSNGWEEALAAA